MPIVLASDGVPLAMCRTAEINVAEHLLRAGLATTRMQTTRRFLELEAAAAEARRGIWAVLGQTAARPRPQGSDTTDVPETMNRR